MGARYWIVGFEWEIGRSFAGGLFVEFGVPGDIALWDRKFEARIDFMSAWLTRFMEWPFSRSILSRGVVPCRSVGLRAGT